MDAINAFVNVGTVIVGFFATMAMAVAGTGAIMKIYATICKVKDDLTLTRSVSQEMLEEVKKE